MPDDRTVTPSSRRARLARIAEAALLPFTAICLAVGIVAHLAGQPALGDGLWVIATVVSAVRLAVGIAIDLRAGSTGVDVIALLAMLGSIALDEYLAGAVIAVMYATGQTLERYAHGRAERELHALLSRAPGIAHRYEADGLVDRPAESLGPGDRLLIKPGEVVPVDGVVVAGPAALDESALTGESRVVVRDLDDRVASGVVNAGAAFDLRASATADASTYAGIVRLVAHRPDPEVAVRSDRRPVRRRLPGREPRPRRLSPGSSRPTPSAPSRSSSWRRPVRSCSRPRSRSSRASRAAPVAASSSRAAAPSRRSAGRASC